MPTPLSVYVLQEAEVGVGESPGVNIISAADTFDLAASDGVQRAQQIKGSFPIITWRMLGPDHWRSNVVLGFQWDITKVEVRGAR